MLVPNMAFAYYNEEMPSGFLWYDDAPTIIEEEKKISQNVESPKDASQNAALRNKALKQKLDDAIQTALDNPTLENAIIAQRVQKEVMNKSEKFSKAWMLAALLDPELLSSKDNPNVLHRKLEKQTNSVADKIKLKEIANNWGLFFYIKPGCIFCERFAPIVKEFAESYQFQVLAISDDGAPFANFKGAKDTGLIANINSAKEAPMLYLVHREGKHIYPIAHGLTDSEKIKENIFLILEINGLKT